MTEEKRNEFKKYGCLSRAIMRVCGVESIDEFCAKYEDSFRGEYYGMPRDEKVEAILTNLGFSIVSRDQEFDVVRKRFDDGFKVIVLSHVSLNPTETGEINHASVLESITDQNFVLWTTSQNGQAGFLPAFTKASWGSKKCHGIAIKPLARGV